MGIFGVIDNNEMYNDMYAFRQTHESAQDGPWYYWAYYPGMAAFDAFGHGDTIYIEDNTITLTGGNTIITSSQNGMRWSLRYNTATISSSYNLLDIHGNQRPSFMSMMGSEIYGNNVISSGGDIGNYLHHRGGQALFFYNNLQNDFCKVQLTEEIPDSNSPPANHAITGQPQHIWKSYYFNNRSNKTGSLFALSINEQIGGIPSANQDFWSQNNWVQSSAGVGCGSSLPGGSCTEGVGFWLTDQSCTDLTDYVGADPTTPISGSLYICNDSNTWVEYYTPYTYPHPLRLRTPPTNLRIINVE